MDQSPLLDMQAITKTFPGVLALENASLRVGHGEVHALIGENGAGKSTMIKVLTGVYRRDGGSILLDGHEVNFVSPQQAQHHGVSTIYQEVNLVPLRSVSENIFMGREPLRWGLIDWRRMNAEASALLARFGIRIDVSRPLEVYNIATQQMVAIARAVSFKSKLVIMDEPTSSLDDHEVATLFEVIRQLRGEGVSVLFVSHRLDELYAVCDRVTIMRDGKTVETQEMARITKLELVAQMLGKELGEVQSRGQTGFGRSAKAVGGEAVEGEEVGGELLRGEGLARGRALRAADVSVRAGEVVGLAGLLGSGRTETARAIFGADPLDAGTVRLDGEPVRFKSPGDAIRAGLGFLSEDRKSEGIVPYLSVRENLTLALLPVLSRHGVVDESRQREIVEGFIRQLGIKTAGPEQKIRELSGGNQQKVLLARWLCLNPRLLILDEPTRGVDVGAKAEIQRLISRLAGEGLGVLMISSELEELTEGSDRVVVLRDGRTVTELPRERLSQDAIMEAMAHGEQSPPVSGAPPAGVQEASRG